MRINFNTVASTNHLSKGTYGMSKYRSESAFERHNATKNNNDQINTTIKSNSDGRVSFKGGAPLLHKLGQFANSNPLVAEAIFALFITCGARPLTIMATAKSEKDKEKCAYQAVKSISSGVVGLATTALVGMPIAAATKLAQKKGIFTMPDKMKQEAGNVVKQGVDALSGLAEKLTKDGREAELVKQIKELTIGDKLNLNVFQNGQKHADKIFKNKISEIAPDITTKVKDSIKAQTQINNYARTGKNVMDKLFQPVFMPLRATITIALVPVILNLLGQKKPCAKEAKVENNPQQSNNAANNENQAQNKQTTKVEGGEKNENK